MATVSSAQAAASFPVYKPTGNVGFGYGVYEIASALSKDDVVEFFKLPPCRVTEGCLLADDIDTGTEALEIDVGTSTTADLFLNSGVLTGDVTTDVKPVAGTRLFFTGLYSGPQALTAAETMVIGTITAAANAGGTGTLYCYAHYLEP